MWTNGLEQTSRKVILKTGAIKMTVRKSNQKNLNFKPTV